MKAFMLHFALEFRAALRNRNLLLMNYLLPLGFYLLIGGMMVQINPFFGDQMIPAMVILTVLSGVIMGLPTNLVEAREAGILRSFRVNGLQSGTLIAIPALANALHVCLTALVITVSAPLIFKVPAPVDWPMYLLVFLLTLFANSGLATLIGVITRSGQMAILWQQLLFIPSMILSGLMVPLTLMPDWGQKLSLMLPATYAMAAFQGSAYEGETLWYAPYGMLLLFVGGVLGFVLASRLFSWDNQNDVQRHRVVLALVAMIPYLLGALLLV
ncbi:MAG TPA: ABC transporter permease [Firmicutes bacterium]|jgi:ABC-2 type transport system permease protein|nr:ABC transporter permease [Bacillota bacterium]